VEVETALIIPLVVDIKEVIGVAGKQGFVNPCFSNLFNIKQLRAK
jgi:hypothetical protein